MYLRACNREIQRIRLFPCYLQLRDCLQELQNILESISLRRAARKTARPKSDNTVKDLLFFIVVAMNCQMKFLILSCPVVKMTLGKLPVLDTMGKSRLNHNLLISICLDQMQDR